MAGLRFVHAADADTAAMSPWSGCKFSRTACTETDPRVGRLFACGLVGRDCVAGTDTSAWLRRASFTARLYRVIERLRETRNTTD
jgi:hypothetical protein